jgi:hypothetical protein
MTISQSTVQRSEETATMNLPDNPIAQQKRKRPRSRVYVVACLRSSEGWEPVRLRDLSRSGALVEATNAPPVGSTVQLVRGSMTVEARVAWIDTTWFGVEFNEPLETGFLANQVGKHLKVSAPRRYRRDPLAESAIDSEWKHD